MIRYLYFLLLVTLSGCALHKPLGSAGSSVETFQLHTGQDGRVYRIDTRTGQTSWLDGSSFIEVKEQLMSQLIIGKVYRAEDGASSYKYVGNGKFEKWGLDQYQIKSQDKSSEKLR